MLGHKNILQKFQGKWAFCLWKLAFISLELSWQKKREIKAFSFIYLFFKLIYHQSLCLSGVAHTVRALSLSKKQEILFISS